MEVHAPRIRHGEVRGQTGSQLEPLGRAAAVNQAVTSLIVAIRSNGMHSIVSRPASISKRSRIIVGNGQERSAGLFHRLAYSRCSPFNGVSRAVRSFRYAVMGVRISWLMFARKRLSLRGFSRCRQGGSELRDLLLHFFGVLVNAISARVRS